MAIIFIVSCHLFLNAYTGHYIAMENLKALKVQERFFKLRISELTHKNIIIETADMFVKKVESIGLTKDKWDNFSVNLSEAPLTFEQFKKIIDQTANSDYYYFKPEFVHLNLLDAKTGQASLIALSQSGSEDADPSSLKDKNLIVSLTGSFLIRK